MPIETKDALECPTCGKKVFIQREPDLYVCLACDHKKDLSQKDSKSADDSPAWIAALIFIILIVLAL